MKAGAVTGKGMRNLCPTSTCGFNLWTRPHAPFSPVPSTQSITSLHPLPLRVIPGSSLRGGGHLCPHSLASTWEAPGRQRSGMASTGGLALVPRAGARQGAQRGHLAP